MRAKLLQIAILLLAFAAILSGQTGITKPGGGTGGGDEITGGVCTNEVVTEIAVDTAIPVCGPVTSDMLSSITSLQLLGKISDETGSGALVFGTSPALTTPNLGTPTAVNLINGTALPLAAVTGINVGTDPAADLEEEDHKAEHQENGADEMLVEDMGTACTDGQVFKANATGGAACGGINTTNIQFSGASVTHNANQTVGDTILAFNTERYDTGSYHDNATNNSRLTVSTTGYYRATCRAAIENTTTTAIFVSVRKNGSTILCTNSEEAHAATNVHRHIGCAVSAKLNATDYVECRAFISGGGKNVLALSDESPTFSIEFLGVD